MAIFIVWLFGAFFVAFVFGTARKIGFWGSFLISLLLSPLLGLIITLFSDDKKKVADREKLIALQEETNRLLREKNSQI